MESLASQFAKLNTHEANPRFYPCHITGLDSQKEFLRVRWTTTSCRGLCYVKDLTSAEKMFVNVFVRGFHIRHPNGPFEVWQKLLNKESKGTHLDVTTSEGLDLVWKLFNRTSPDSTKASEDGSVVSAESVQSVTAEDIQSVTNFANEMSYNDVTVAIGQLEQRKAALDKGKDALIEEMLVDLEKKKVLFVLCVVCCAFLLKFPPLNPLLLVNVKRSDVNTPPPTTQGHS